MLDDGVVGRPAVDERDGVQRDADADEVEDFVDEGPEQREREIAIVNPVPFFFFFFFQILIPNFVSVSARTNFCSPTRRDR